MDPTGTPREISPVTPRETIPGIQKTPVNLSSITHRDIYLLSPGIYDNYSLSRSTNSVTPERMT